ncbi:glycosyltransferase family 2 protein [Paludibacterium yongneupense]|uniref:glycosyltransferase family 2 protein n=1 Tax=Paludibacterium yongneupense TaxID=400061 RepID=UPI0004150CE0|nr:glycosyltransferase family 2 protein [Paludibacterium yongneupense]
MRFLPCLLIPCYNHGSTIAATIERLREYGYPIFLVDDGSDEVSRLELERVAAREPLLRLIRHPRNLGKGAAVMRAMREAHAAGHSHGLQVDADGQHALQDVPRFFELARRHPDTVVCGRPVYDDSVPRARLYGRYLTHFWVWVETLSFAIGDSMCGYRCYPLAPAVALIARGRIPLRMDFDSAMIVRLYWMGLPVRNLATRVIYPAGGLSHFDALRDNLRISKMHALLFCGMLPRIPMLLWRRLRRSAS